jgi:hypothetical protein
MLSVVMLSVVMLSVIMLSVIILSVIMLNVVAPKNVLFYCNFMYLRVPTGLYKGAKSHKIYCFTD